MFTVGSLKLYQTYLIDFINPFPGHNTPQTFIAYTSDVATVHDDIDKIKIMFLVLNCYIISDEINFFMILHSVQFRDIHPPPYIDLHKTDQRKL